MKKMSRIPIAFLPTPIEKLTRLSQLLGGPDLYIKRDDQTGLAFGGNKTRKLEYFAADALSCDAKTLVTTGAAQSNHCRQTAAAASKLGLDCVLVLTKTDDQTESQSKKNLSGNLLLDHLLGAEIVWAANKVRDETLKSVFQTLQEKGRKPYMIPYGGSNKFGVSAFAFAVKEVVLQISDNSQFDRQPDWIVLPSSSGGTQAGLLLGAREFGYTGKILGISVDEKAHLLKNRITDLANETAEFHASVHRFNEKDILINDDFLGRGYGIPGEVEIEAMRLLARYEGIMVDPVYTARAAGGLFQLIRDAFFDIDLENGCSILFWHTGGSPAIFADQYRDLV